MLRVTTLFLVILNIPIFRFQHVSQCISSFDVTNVVTEDTKLSGYVLKTHPNVQTWLQCSELCLKRSMCASFNYNSINMTCEINYWMGTPVPEINWVYAKRSSIPKGIVLGCANHTCGDHQVCVPEGQTHHSCLDFECIAEVQYQNFDVTNGADGVTYLSCREGLVGIGDNKPQCVYNITTNTFTWNTTFDCYNVSTCYIVMDGRAVYNGSVAVDEKGDPCETWITRGHSESEMEPLFVSASSNYCRDYDSKGYPECYIHHTGPAHDDYRLDRCDVPEC